MLIHVDNPVLIFMSDSSKTKKKKNKKQKTLVVSLTQKFVEETQFTTRKTNKHLYEYKIGDCLVKDI